MVKDRVIAIVETLLIGLLIFSAVNIALIAADYYRGDQIYDDSADTYFKEETSGDPTAKEDKAFTVDLASLKKINPDIVGWIYIKGAVSYPLLQCNNNEKYLAIAYNNLSSKFGSIFIDYRCNASFEDKNTIIYGHNMKNGSMFGPLKRYKDSTFLTEHPYIYIITPEFTYKYKIFSAYTTNAYSAAYTLTFADDKTYLDYLKKAKSNSQVDTDVQVNAYDKIITLSTCTSNSEDGRFVVQAKLSETINS